MRLLGVWLTVLALVAAVFYFSLLLATSPMAADQAEKSPGDPSGGACSCTLDKAMQCLMAGDTENRVEDVMAAFKELGGELMKLQDVSEDQLPEKLHHLQAIMEGKEGTHGVNLSSVLSSMKARVGDLHEENIKEQLHKARVLLDSSQLGETLRHRRDTGSFISNIQNYFFGNPDKKLRSPGEKRILNQIHATLKNLLFEGKRGVGVPTDEELKKVKKEYNEKLQQLMDLLEELHSKEEDKLFVLTEMGAALGEFMLSKGVEFREPTFAQLPLEQGNQTS